MIEFLSKHLTQRWQALHVRLNLSGVIVAAKAAEPSVDTSLNTGDVIHALNGVQVETMAALRSAVDHLAPNSSVALQIERNGRLMFVSFEVD